jgi:transcriptional regulator with XRE-family HTH domain
MSQQAFANELGLSISAIATYEAGRNPTGRALVSLAKLAKRHRKHNLAMLFWESFLEECGLNGKQFQLFSHTDKERGYRGHVFYSVDEESEDLEQDFFNAVQNVIVLLQAGDEGSRNQARERMRAFIDWRPEGNE